MDAKADFQRDVKQNNLVAKYKFEWIPKKPRDLRRNTMDGPVKVWPTLPSVWDRCEFLRISEGLTIREFAAKIGVDPSTLYLWKRKREPRPSTFLKICETFKCPMEWLTGKYVHSEEPAEEKLPTQENQEPEVDNEETKGFELKICGTYTGAELKAIVGSLLDAEHFEAKVVITK